MVAGLDGGMRGWTRWPVNTYTQFSLIVFQIRVTQILSQTKKGHWAALPCGVWVYSWILGFISYVPCYSFIAFYAWIVCYNWHVWCLSIPVQSFECRKPVRVGPRWLLWAVRLGVETIPNNVSAFLWQQPLDDHLEPWLSVYSGQR